jgi:hypothetical protein
MDLFEIATTIFIGVANLVIATVMIPDQNQHSYELPRVEAA